MTRNRLSLALLAWLLLIAACSSGNDEQEGADQPEQSAESDESADGEDSEDEAPAIPVEVSIPDRGSVYALYTGTAPIEAYAEADVIAKVGGEIRELLVEEGDDVRKGQVLARLDGEKLQLELNESRARLDKLKRDFERNTDLKEKSLISDGDFEKIKFEMEALQASYNLAKLELDYTQIRAPIDGVVSERYVRLGNTIGIGNPLYRVTSLDPLVAYLFVPEREYQSITAGKPVGISIDALGDNPIQASVTRVSPIVDPATGTFKITVEISDPERRIKPGMFARLGIVYDQRDDVLRVPRSALLDDRDQTSVYVIEDNIAKRRVVETGYSDRGMVEITSGLSDGEQVVTVGQVGLKEDSEVDIINLPDDENNPEQVTDNASTD